MSRGRRKRGFSGVELAVVIAVIGVVIGGVYQVFVANQRIESSRESNRGGPDSIQVALDVLLRELREVSPSEGDLTTMAPREVAFRAARAFGITCDVVSSRPTTLTVAATGRPFEAGDEVFVYVEEPATGEIGWAPASVERVVGTATCGDSSDPAQTLVLEGRAGTATLDGVLVGSFVRAWEPVRYFVSEEEGHPYLVRELAGDRTPLVGPLVPDAGFTLAFLTEGGGVAEQAWHATTAEITVRTLNTDAVADGLGVDSVGTVVFLRN